MFETPSASIGRIVDSFRANAYHALRAEVLSTERQRLLTELMPEFEFETRQLAEGAPAIGQTLRELDLRARTGVTLLAVRRDAAFTTVPAADFQFQRDDLLVLAGSGRQIADAVRILVEETKTSN